MVTIRSMAQSEINQDTARQTQCQHKHTTMTIFRTVHCANQMNVSVWSRWLLRYYKYDGDDDDDDNANCQLKTDRQTDRQTAENLESAVEVMTLRPADSLLNIRVKRRHSAPPLALAPFRRCCRKHIHTVSSSRSLQFDFYFYKTKCLSLGDIVYVSPHLTFCMGRDSSVGIATRYGLDRPGIESRWGRDFPHPSQTFRGAHPASYTKGTGSFPEGKAAGAWCWPPTPI